MGLNLGVQFKTVKVDEDFVKCVPEAKYEKFPVQLRQPVGALILETEAFQPRLFHNKSTQPHEQYWWTDVMFVPHNDSTLFITGGIMVPRAHHPWLTNSRFPPGRTLKLNLKNQTARYLNDTRMTNYPKLHMHPSGKYFGYIHYECIKVETLDHEEVYNKHKDLRSCNYKFCAFSPNGKYLAILLTASKHVECLLSHLDKGYTFHDIDVDLTKMFPKFKAAQYNEHLECKWSPDSEHIAICTNDWFCFILNKDLELVVNVTENILPDMVFPSWSGTFDFDPRSCHQIMAVGANDRKVYILNTKSEAVALETEPVSREAIDNLAYHPFGHSIAVGMRDFNIYFFDPDNGQVTYQIDMKFHTENLTTKYGNYPALIRASFSSTGNELATSTCDGRVQLWQLPSDISLFTLCKWALLSHVPQSKLRDLPLPEKIVSKLLSVPTSY